MRLEYYQRSAMRVPAAVWPRAVTRMAPQNPTFRVNRPGAQLPASQRTEPRPPRHNARAVSRGPEATSVATIFNK